MLKVDTVKIKLDDGGRGSIKISNQDSEIELAATFGVKIFARAGHATYVTIRMLADVEFEGPIELTVE